MWPGDTRRRGLLYKTSVRGTAGNQRGRMVKGAEIAIKALRDEVCSECDVERCIRLLEGMDVPIGNAHRTKIKVPVPATGSKVCRNCNTVKKLEDFPAVAKCKDGHSNVCKKCRYQKKKQSRVGKLENKPKVMHKQSTGTGAGTDIEGSNDLTHPHVCKKCSKRFETLNYLLEHQSNRGHFPT